MAVSMSGFSALSAFSPYLSKNSSRLLPYIEFPVKGGCGSTSLSCYAAAKQQKSGATPATNRKRRPGSKNGNKGVVQDFEIEKSRRGDSGVEVLESPSQSSHSPYTPLPMPKPPAGFLLDVQGKVIRVSDRRIATIVDSTNNSPLECVIRRVFTNSHGDECLLLCPVDTPVQILKSVNVEGWSAIGDEEVEAILPSAAYALAKIHMHLVCSGFCYTARGGFCYSEEDVFEFHIDSGEDVDGLPTEVIEITCFHMDGSHYMIYTPSDPLLFVAIRDKSGALHIADDELLEDPAVISAIDEETEFNALVEEEAVLLDSLLGKR